MLLLNMSLILITSFFPLNSALANTDTIQLHLKMHSVKCNVISEMEYELAISTFFFVRCE